MQLVRPNGPGPYSTILEKAGLADQGYTFHSWSHTFRTRLSEAKVSTELAKKLGGWTVDKTAERYDHAERIEELRAAVRGLERSGERKPEGSRTFPALLNSPNHRRRTALRFVEAQVPHQVERGGGVGRSGQNVGCGTEDATAARYDHAERVEELRAAVEKAK